MDPVDRMVAALATQDGVPYVYRLDEADSHAFMAVPSFSPDHPYSSLLTNPSQKLAASLEILLFTNSFPRVFATRPDQYY